MEQWGKFALTAQTRVFDAMTSAFARTCVPTKTFCIQQQAMVYNNIQTASSKEASHKSGHRQAGQKFTAKEIKITKLKKLKTVSLFPVWSGFQHITNYRRPSPGEYVKRRRPGFSQGVTLSSLKAFADQPAPVFTQIFNRSLDVWSPLHLLMLNHCSRPQKNVSQD